MHLLGALGVNRASQSCSGRRKLVPLLSPLMRRCSAVWTSNARTSREWAVTTAPPKSHPRARLLSSEVTIARSACLRARPTHSILSTRPSPAPHPSAKPRRIRRLTTTAKTELDPLSLISFRRLSLASEAQCPPSLRRALSPRARWLQTWKIRLQTSQWPAVCPANEQSLTLRQLSRLASNANPPSH